jgi:quercetin dioxygenase-like cupin family protein
MTTRKTTTRRDLLALFAVLGTGASGSHAQDPVKLAPRNYRVAFENDKLRVLEYYSKPGLGLCGHGRHFHPAHLVFALTPAKVKVTLPDGKTIIAANKPGEIFWEPAGTHTVENIGANDVRAYLVEPKDAAWSPSTWSEKG